MPIDESTIQKAFAEKLVKFGYRKDVVQKEYPVRIGSYGGRADVVILNKNARATQEEIFFIAEIKKAGSGRAAAYKQLQSYISASLNCRYGALVIGNAIEYFAVETANGKKTLKAINTLPTGYGTQHDYGSTKDRLQLEDSSPSEYTSPSTPSTYASKPKYDRPTIGGRLNSRGAWLVPLIIILLLSLVWVELAILFAYLAVTVLIALTAPSLWNTLRNRNRDKR